MGTRKQVMVSIDSKVLTELAKVKEETGIPLSRQLELAWKKVNE